MPERGVELAPGVKSNFLRRFWLKYIKKEPPIVYRGEYGVLARLLERRHADVLHVYFGHTGVHLLPFIQRWPKPVVVSFHGMDVQTRAHDPTYEIKLRELLQAATLVLARSQSLLNQLHALGCPAEKVRMNRTGIPLEQFPYVERTYPDDGAWHFVQACRLIEKKGLDDTLQAFATFHARHPKAHLTIAGEGRLLQLMEELRDKLGLQDCVEFTGFLNGADLCALYHRAHIFLHPSRMTEDQNQEGIPNSMLEAMASGAAIIATNHGGIPEAVTHQVSGLLVEENDCEALAKEALTLMASPEMALSIPAQGRRSVERMFDRQTNIAHLEQTYLELLQE